MTARPRWLGQVVSMGVWIVLVAVVVALGFGAYRARTDGRFRRRLHAEGGPGVNESSFTPGEVPAVKRPPSADSPAPAASTRSTWAELAEVAAVAPGERATLVQFSSAFCAPCRTTRGVLSDVAETVPGVVHVDIDAEQHLDVVRRLDILRTPTTLILDAAGNEIARASGAPRKEQVLSAIPPLHPIA